MNRYDKNFSELVSDLVTHRNQLDIIVDTSPNVKNPCIFKCKVATKRVELYLTNLKDDVMSKLSATLSYDSTKKIIYIVKDYQQLEQYQLYCEKYKDRFKYDIKFITEHEFENSSLDYFEFNNIIFDDFSRYMEIKSIRNKLIIKLLEHNPYLKLIGFIDEINGKLINEYAYLGIKFDDKMNKIVKSVFAHLSQYEQVRDDAKIDEAIQTSHFDRYLDELDSNNINYILSYPKV